MVDKLLDATSRVMKLLSFALWTAVFSIGLIAAIVMLLDVIVR
jgi:hypothetical protein